MTMSGDKNFDRETLERALAELGRRAFAAGRTVEIVIYGGSALLLTLNRQINTGEYTAKPEYLFAMKCRAMRVGGIETNSDVDDIKLLIRAIGLNNSQDAMALVEKFYPQNMLQPKTRLGLEEIFSNLGLDQGNDPLSPP
jgi:hypothetical protein